MDARRLFERYRPTTLAEVVGQPKAVAMVERLIERGAGGKAFWISGPSGAGKTSIAKIIANTHTNGTGIVEFDAADDLGAAELETIDAALTFRPLWGERERRVWIVNEAHGLRAAAIRRLLGILERVASDPEQRIAIIFTTTRDGEEDLFGNQVDASPLLSRCFPVRLTNQGLARAFAESCLRIARIEGLDGQPIEKYIALANKHKSNKRGMLNDIEAGCMIADGGAA